MRFFRTGVILSVILAGCGLQKNYQFVDWTRLKDIGQPVGEVPISDLILKDDIATICQLSPYSSTLPQYPEYEKQLQDAKLVPGESEFIFAYFGSDNRLIGSDKIQAHRGQLRAEQTVEFGYICVSAADGQITVSKSDDFVSFGLAGKTQN